MLVGMAPGFRLSRKYASARSQLLLGYRSGMFRVFLLPFRLTCIESRQLLLRNDLSNLLLSFLVDLEDSLPLLLRS